MHGGTVERALQFLAVAVSATSATAVYYHHQIIKVGIFAETAAVAPLERAYGPSHHSRYFEEWIIRDFFHDRRGGTLLDVGANDTNTNPTRTFSSTIWAGRG